MSYEGFQSPSSIKWQGGGAWGLANYDTGRQPLVKFYPRPVLNMLKSQESGTPIHDTKIFIKIQHPGETLQQIDREVNPRDRQDYAHAWQAFMENREQIPDGTPIYYLFPDHPDIAENLKSLGIHTVEQCAHLSSSAMDRIGMGAQDYVNAANAYMDAAKQGVTFHKMRSELERRDGEISTLKKQLDMQMAQIQHLTSQLEGPGEFVRVPAGFVAQHNMEVQHIAPVKKDHLAMPSSLRKKLKVEGSKEIAV